MFFIRVSYNELDLQQSEGIFTEVMDVEEVRKVFAREWNDKKPEDMKVGDRVSYTSGLSDEKSLIREMVIRII
jgi:hypothetical protein